MWQMLSDFSVSQEPVGISYIEKMGISHLIYEFSPYEQLSANKLRS